MHEARVVIAAGGTAGHVVPAIAVADALRAEGARVSFAGTRERAEAKLVPEAGYEIDFIAVSGLDRRNPLRAAAAVARSLGAVREARGILRRREAGVVLGGGGYVAGPVGAAGLTLGLPLVLTEADSHLGLANRLLAPRARRVCLSFPIEGRRGERYLLTGRPVPGAVLAADRASARRRFGVADDERCIAVVGGSLGARSLNEAAFQAFAPVLARDDTDGEGSLLALADRLRVVHVAGRRDYPELLERRRAAGEPARYVLLEYEPNLGDVLAAADLAVSRSGGSVMEIAAAGRPAVLVPYPHATGDHQGANARWMRDGGGAVIVEDRELTPDGLAQLTADLIADEARLARMADASRRLAKPDAAQRIAAEVLAAVREGT